MQFPEAFNIRVYGILMDDDKRLLVSDEFIRGSYFTKLPGGGLEFGEGTRECLKREFKEETGMDVEVGEHIYTTDFYIMSAFNSKHQIISIYYFVKVNGPITVETKTTPFDFTPQQTADATSCCEIFRWIDWKDLSEDSVTLPIDKVVVNLLKEKLS
jgi:ADP-ribose pyrophosphatase YjhB (NUDIX family)